MSASTRRESADAGETLVEVLMSILVISIMFVALMAGFGTSIGISVIHKQQTTAQTIGRDFGEYLQYYTPPPAEEGVKYINCGTKAQYLTAGAVSSFNSTYKLPDGSTPLAGASPTYSVTLTDVSYWDGNTAPAGYGSTCTSDLGTQRMSFTVTSLQDTSITQSLQVVKRK